MFLHKKCTLKRFSYQFASCCFVSRNHKDRDRFTFHCLPSHNKMFTMFPFLHTLFAMLSFFLLNFIIWNWLVKMAEDQIGPVKCDLIRSCFINALLSYKQEIILLYLHYLKARCWNLFFFRAFNFAFFKMYLNSTVIFVT